MSRQKSTNLLVSSGGCAASMWGGGLGQIAKPNPMTGSQVATPLQRLKANSLCQHDDAGDGRNRRSDSGGKAAEDGRQAFGQWGVSLLAASAMGLGLSLLNAHPLLSVLITLAGMASLLYPAARICGAPAILDLRRCRRVTHDFNNRAATPRGSERDSKLYRGALYVCDSASTNDVVDVPEVLPPGRSAQGPGMAPLR